MIFNPYCKVKLDNFKYRVYLRPDLIDCDRKSTNLCQSFFEFLNGKSLHYRYLANAVTSVREHYALSYLKDLDIFKYILNPKTFLDNSNEIKKISQTERKLITTLTVQHELNQGQAKAVARSYFLKENFVLIQGAPRNR